MRLSHTFIERPIFAGVIAVVITIIGALAYFGLPVSQYPDVVPPTVTVSATYPGASSETIADTVAAPLEQEINGVDNMLYVSSQSTGDGRLTITVTFKLGTDLDEAQVLVQNRVAQAEPRLPEEVRRQGVVTRKTAPDFLLVANLVSPGNVLDRAYISNYALTQMKDRLARLDGVGEVRIFGARDFAMRVWIDPGRAASRNMTAGEIVEALRSQNVQVAAGAIGRPPETSAPAYELNVETQGRLTSPEQFENIVIKTDAEGRLTRLRDVARVELGAEDYGVNTYLSGQQSLGIAVFQRPGSNALAAADAVLAEIDTMSKRFPAGLEYRVIYNPTEFIRESVKAVQHTLFEAVILVVIVILVFLQSWRAAIIPVLAIPVSLTGTFAVLAAAGFSLNNLSLFGLVLAIGIVVDDAIVVVENVERNLEAGLTPREAAHKSMDEVSTALIAIVLVLCAVFVPTMFLTGLTGQFYRQFAVTIASATIISLVLSLTLSPALAAILLRPKHEEATGNRWQRLVQEGGRRFNAGFDRLSAWYAATTRRLLARPKTMLFSYAGLLVAAVFAFSATPVGFVPTQDQGYILAATFTPPGTSLAQTDKVLRETADKMMKIPGVKGAVMLTGFHAPSGTQASNAAAAFLVFDSFEERAKHGGQTEHDIFGAAQKIAGGINAGRVFVIPPPLIRGIGTGGGFKLMLQDRAGKGYGELNKIAWGIIGEANKDPALAMVHTKFEAAAPRLYADIDRAKADMLGVNPSRVFEALQVYLGSAYVNDFNLLGRTFRVTAQADLPFRDDAADVSLLKTRSASGAMVPVGSVAKFEDRAGPYRAIRYNLYPAIDIEGDLKPGHSSGEAIAAMERLTANLPQGVTTEWTEVAYQQKMAGNAAIIVFAAATLFVFLVLAAQFESLMLPLAIILIVPMTLLAAMIGVNLRGMDNNVLTQIGLIVLIGLAAKNAILIVEFAKQGEDEGRGIVDAVVHAAQQRLRPILMTSFAFILGVVPLVIASGPGAELRQALGTAVFSGMLGVTFFGLVFTPIFYVACRTLAERFRRNRGGTQAPAAVPAE
ncbi:efflux RND transporter permease subunit [Sphingomonas jatrophae]|uniref:Efflux pump membrane transporter n=1 Tax=Sphingomonas jatrophae TaxID=1166337 RepID=A0A1I6JS98_9SPHN|nr:multidrug efflux RND transporter permease subunit [Sphingomonas jatrophae]SFR81808.1 hydrophobe/amphiphile efflux-1 (HAE1) family protein [Sphingomonas jatrophae]